MKKKCCVFGGSGFIGRHLVHTLSKDLSRSVFSINRNLVETKDKLLKPWIDVVFELCGGVKEQCDA